VGFSQLRGKVAVVAAVDPVPVPVPFPDVAASLSSETLAKINGSPAILFWDEASLAVVISLTLSAVGIQEIYALLNPEKLAYLQKQLSNSRRLSSFE